jgi:hypothetical protein
MGYMEKPGAYIDPLLLFAAATLKEHAGDDALIPGSKAGLA